ncbi:MAG TPA: methyltransferase [Bryobacteraceae bacterium]|nr:methyltransferase [Bryobacteraceae bacterium]
MAQPVSGAGTSAQPQTPPPHAALLQMLTGKWVSFMISAVAKFGIADHLKSGPRSVEELASVTGTQKRALYRLLRAAAGVGIFAELADGRFEQTPLSDPLRSDANPCVRNMALFLVDEFHMRSWEQLPWCVETGRPGPYKIYGMGAFDWLTKHPEEGVNFNNAMTDMSQSDAPAIASSYDFSQFERIVDVAGGHGTLLAAILEKTPHLRGILLEMPHVAEEARKSPILAAYRDRAEILGGSFFEQVPEADAYIMKHIIHDWDDPEAIKILSNCRKAIRPGGKLLVADKVVPGGNEPSLSKLMDLEMMVMPGGLERTEPEWRELFAASGFRLTNIVTPPGMNCIIEGVPV